MRATSLEIINHWVMGGQRHQDIAKNMKKEKGAQMEGMKDVAEVKFTWPDHLALGWPCHVQYTLSIGFTSHTNSR